MFGTTFPGMYAQVDRQMQNVYPNYQAPRPWGNRPMPLLLKACSNCGNASHETKLCQGCSKAVCGACMVEEEERCLTCLTSCDVQKTCGNCGSCCCFPMSCYSCAMSVCSICMVVEEGCCLGCLETFPVSPRLSPSFQPKVMAPLVQEPPVTTALPLLSQSLLMTYQPQAKDETNDRLTDGVSTACSGQASDVASNEDQSHGAFTTETTLMICNVPCRLGRHDVINAIDSVGFYDKIDFVHMPGPRHGSKRKGNMGYAFVNFMDSQDAEHFAVKFENFQFPGTSSTKRCTLKFAHHQGFNAVDAVPSRRTMSRHSLH